MLLYPVLTLKCTVGLVFIVNGALQVFMYVCMYVVIEPKASSPSVVQFLCTRFEDEQEGEGGEEEDDDEFAN